MKLITKKQLREVYMAGRAAGRKEEQDLQNLNLNQPHRFCNTGCRTSKCLKAAPKKEVK